MNIKDVSLVPPVRRLLIATSIQFEAFGFCKPGEGMAFVRDHRPVVPGGTLPMNTGGGQISAGQAACSSHNLDRGGAAAPWAKPPTPSQGHRQRAGDRHRLDQLRAQLGLERGACVLALNQ